MLNTEGNGEEREYCWFSRKGSLRAVRGAGESLPCEEAAALRREI